MAGRALAHPPRGTGGQSRVIRSDRRVLGIRRERRVRFAGHETCCAKRPSADVADREGQDLKASDRAPALPKTKMRPRKGATARSPKVSVSPRRNTPECRARSDWISSSPARSAAPASRSPSLRRRFQGSITMSTKLEGKEENCQTADKEHSEHRLAERRGEGRGRERLTAEQNAGLSRA